MKTLRIVWMWLERAFLVGVGDVDRAEGGLMEFETRAIHAGQDPDPTTGAIVTPIYASSTFVQEEVGVHKGYEYSRSGNPTRTALQECVASLESAEHGLAFASGLAASDAVMRLVSPGDHFVIPNDAYGG